jgi:tetraacyldisaccharide 4'-kinase
LQKMVITPSCTKKSLMPDEMLLKLIETAWARKNALYYLVLVPLSWLFAVIIYIRKSAYQLGILKSCRLPVPVIVVGNITVGGNGKTPVVMWLVEQLRSHGYQPGVVSRGYGGSSKLPTSVNAHSNTAEVGDEPVLIASRCDCPVWVGTNRLRVATELLKAHPDCNIIVSDDGLQHYALKRDVEIVVTQPEQRTEKLRLLPAGPLREPLTRLKTVDAIVSNGEKSRSEHSNPTTFEMQLIGEQFYNLLDNNIKASAADFKHKTIKAIAGIGKPVRFFEHLNKLGMDFSSASFDDHYAYTAQDLARMECDVLIMTEKDAVKCKAFAQPHHWVLPVQASIDAGLMPLILNKIGMNKLAKR